MTHFLTGFIICFINFVKKKFLRFQKIFSYEPLEHFTLKREMSVRFRVLNKIGQRFEIGFALGTTETSFITMLTYHMRFKLGHRHHCLLFTGLQKYSTSGKLMTESTSYRLFTINRNFLNKFKWILKDKNSFYSQYLTDSTNVYGPLYMFCLN